MDAPLQDLPGRGFHCRRCGDAVTPADDAHPIAWCGRCRRVGVAVRVPFTPVVAPAVSPAVTAG